MGHSYSISLYHCVFSTHRRQKMITPDLEKRLFPFMGGIARKNEMKLISIGGHDDHAHLILSLPSTLSIADALKTIKGKSSEWVHKNFPDQRLFQWQEGYGAFSIGVSGVARTAAYIRNQKEHHQRRPFEEEFIAFLKRHGMDYKNPYVFD